MSSPANPAPAPAPRRPDDEKDESLVASESAAVSGTLAVEAQLPPLIPNNTDRIVVDVDSFMIGSVLW